MLHPLAKRHPRMSRLVHHPTFEMIYGLVLGGLFTINVAPLSNFANQIRAISPELGGKFDVLVYMSISFSIFIASATTFQFFRRMNKIQREQDTTKVELKELKYEIASLKQELKEHKDNTGFYE